MTHTYAVMEISDAAYEEIKALILAAGYQHAVDADGNIDMHGMAVNRTVASLNASPKRTKGPHCATCQCANIHDERHVPDNPRSRSWHKNAPNGPPK